MTTGIQPASPGAEPAARQVALALQSALTRLELASAETTAGKAKSNEQPNTIVSFIDKDSILIDNGIDSSAPALAGLVSSDSSLDSGGGGGGGGGGVSEISSLFQAYRVHHVLTNREEEFKYLVILAEAGTTNWTTVAQRQADAILIVARAGEDVPTAVSDAEQAVFAASRMPPPAERKRRRAGSPPEKIDEDCGLPLFAVDLVLVHSANTLQPSNTRQWTASRPRLSGHHHVRLDGSSSKDNSGTFQRHVERIGRHLTGRSIGVILGGGGARGLAHVGVLAAMQANGVPVDAIGGSSQGSFVAATFAQHDDVELMSPTISEFCASMSSNWSFLKELTLPLLSTTTGHGFSQLLRKLLAGQSATSASSSSSSSSSPSSSSAAAAAASTCADIQDLWIPFFCCTTNVSTSRSQVHRSGPVWKYVRASMTVLGYFPPVYDGNGDLLVLIILSLSLCFLSTNNNFSCLNK